MPSITLKVSYENDTYTVLAAERGEDFAAEAFGVTPLTILGVFPQPGDLLVDERMTQHTLRVVQRTMTWDKQGNLEMELLTELALDARLSRGDESEVVLTKDGDAALFAEYIGRTAPAASAFDLTQRGLDLRVGDVIKDSRLSRHTWSIVERMFRWQPDGGAVLRHLLDVGMTNREWGIFNDDLPET